MFDSLVVRKTVPFTKHTVENLANGFIWTAICPLTSNFPLIRSRWSSHSRLVKLIEHMRSFYVSIRNVSRWFIIVLYAPEMNIMGYLEMSVDWNCRNTSFEFLEMYTDDEFISWTHKTNPSKFAWLLVEHIRTQTNKLMHAILMVILFRIKALWEKNSIQLQ